MIQSNIFRYNLVNLKYVNQINFCKQIGWLNYNFFLKMIAMLNYAHIMYCLQLLWVGCFNCVYLCVVCIIICFVRYRMSIFFPFFQDRLLPYELCFPRKLISPQEWELLVELLCRATFVFPLLTFIVIWLMIDLWNVWIWSCFQIIENLTSQMHNFITQLLNPTWLSLFLFLLEISIKLWWFWKIHTTQLIDQIA